MCSLSEFLRLPSPIFRPVRAFFIDPICAAICSSTRRRDALWRSFFPKFTSWFDVGPRPPLFRGVAPSKGLFDDAWRRISWPAVADRSDPGKPLCRRHFCMPLMPRSLSSRLRPVKLFRISRVSAPRHSLCFAESDGGRRRWEAPPASRPLPVPRPRLRLGHVPGRACAGMRRSPPCPSGRRGSVLLFVGEAPHPSPWSAFAAGSAPCRRSGLNPPRFVFDGGHVFGVR